MAQRIDKPFLHLTIPNFLTQADHSQLSDVYSKLQFFEKDSDLFHFFQTNQLNSESSLDFFKAALTTEFAKLTDLSESSYNIFASYYFNGDYLLCHDDVVEDRRFAFSYYLQDHPSGELVLYDDTATKAVRKYKVTRNLLVIFEVSNISYHQVAYCAQDGRKAVTGWLNIKGQGAKREQKAIAEFKANIPSDIMEYKLQENLEEEEFYQFPQIQYCFDAEKEEIVGPFYERKATKLELDQTVVFQLEGYTLFSADFFKFSEGDYVLLNDPINSLGESILDVFIVQLGEGVENSEESLVQILDEQGNVSGIPYMNNSVFIVHRNNRNYFVDRVDKPFFLGHLMYRKTKAKKAKKQERTKAHVMDIRKKLANFYKQKDGQAEIVPQSMHKTKPIKKTKEPKNAKSAKDKKPTKK